MPMNESKDPTPYAVICKTHGRVYLTKEEYEYQLMRANARWQCPRTACGRTSEWDDETYERHMEGDHAED